MSDEQGFYRTPPLPFRSFRLTASKKEYFSSNSEVIKFKADEHQRELNLVLKTSPELLITFVNVAKEPTSIRDVIADRFGKDRVTAYLKEFPVRLFASYKDPREIKDAVRWAYHKRKPSADDSTFRIRVEYEYRTWIAVSMGNVVVGTTHLDSSNRAPKVVLDGAKMPELKAKSQVYIHVINEEDGGTISEFSIQYEFQPGQHKVRKMARHQDSNRDLILADMSPGPYKAWVRAKGYARELVFFNVPTQGDSHVNIGMLKSGYLLKGQVRDHRGDPVAGANIYFASMNGDSKFKRQGQTKTAQDGTFFVDELPRRRFLVVVDAGKLGAFCVVSDPRVKEEALAISLGRPVRVEIVPNDMERARKFAVFNTRGQPVYDDHLVGRTSLGGDRTLFLPAGNYEAVVYDDVGEIGRNKFTAEDGVVVEILVN